MPTSIYEINRKYQLNDAYFQTIDTVMTKKSKNGLFTDKNGQLQVQNSSSNKSKNLSMIISMSQPMYN